jgi:phage terminase large subunit GpA-like protein
LISESLDFSLNNFEFFQEQIENLTDAVEHKTPVEFVEENRYLSRGESKYSGLMSMDLTPYWIKPLNQMDPYDPTREIWVRKGVKTAYSTTLMDNAIFYLLGFLRAYPGMFVSADKELAQRRVSKSIVPMFNNSGMGNVFKSLDEENSRKGGKTKGSLEVNGGGHLDIEGAKNADKMRDYAPMFFFGDEFATFKPMKNDGDTIALLLSRLLAFWDMRKAVFGTTPLLKGGYADVGFLKGNQQEYYCRCLKCGYAMPLKWFHADLNDKEVKRGLIWEYKDNGQYDINSIRYECWNCGNGHEEHHKPEFINKDTSFWKATAIPKQPHIESYQVPGLISRINPWHQLVGLWHEAYGITGKVENIDKLKVFYNNALGSSFEYIGHKLHFQTASGHRRSFYRKGQIPNNHILTVCHSEVMFLGMTVDVQDFYLSVTIWGFTEGSTFWNVDYFELEDKEGVLRLESPAWERVRELIDEETWKADDGKEYYLAATFIDSSDGDAEPIVSDFCSRFEQGVYPIKGDSYSSKRLQSFKKLKTSSGAEGFLIAVDHYKDKLSPVLRRMWDKTQGIQNQYHLNLPVDISDKEIKQLTVEYKRTEKRGGEDIDVWYRPKGSKNELWDLLVYAACLLDVVAFTTCTVDLDLDKTSMSDFWKACESGLFFDVD